MTAKYRIRGFVPQLTSVPCFATPIYSRGDGQYTHIAGEDGAISEFIRAEIPADMHLIEASSPRRSLAVGDPPSFAYRLPSGLFLEGERAALWEQLREHRVQLELHPMASLEVAEFLGDVQWARQAQEDAIAQLETLNPNIARSWIHWGPASWHFNEPRQVAFWKSLDIAKAFVMTSLLVVSAIKAVLRRPRAKIRPLSIPRSLIEYSHRTSSSSADSPGIFEQALSAQRLHQHSRAIELLREALRECSVARDRAVLHYHYAKSLAINGTTAAAFMQFREALCTARELGLHRLAERVQLDLAALHAQSGKLGEATKILLELKKALRQRKETPEYGDVLISLGRVARSSGRLDQSKKYLQRALDLDRRIEHRIGEADALFELGVVAFYRGNTQQALDRQESAIGIYVDLGSPTGEANCSARMGQIYVVTGRIAKGKILLEKSRLLYERIGFEFGKCAVMNEMAVAHMHEGDLETAFAYFNSAREICERIDDSWTLARLFGNFAIIHSIRGEYDDAIEYNSQAIALYRLIGDPYGKARCLNNLAIIASDKGDQNVAMEHYQEALEGFTAVGDVREQGIALLNIGSCWLDSHTPQAMKAVRSLLHAKQLLSRTDDRESIAFAINNLGEAYYEMDRFEQAAQHFTRALTLLEQVNNPLGIGHALGNLALVVAILGEDQRGAGYFKSAARLLDTHGCKPALAEVKAKWGLALLKRRQARAAKPILESAQSIFVELDLNTRWAIRVRSELDSIATR